MKVGQQVGIGSLSIAECFRPTMPVAASSLERVKPSVTGSGDGSTTWGKVLLNKEQLGAKEGFHGNISSSPRPLLVSLPRSGLDPLEGKQSKNATFWVSAIKWFIQISLSVDHGLMHRASHQLFRPLLLKPSRQPRIIRYLRKCAI